MIMNIKCKRMIKCIPGMLNYVTLGMIGLSGFLNGPIETNDTLAFACCHIANA